MTIRRTNALIAVVGAVVVSVALFAGSASATLPPPGGGGVCSNYASGTTTFAMAVATTACYSYEVGFYAYNPDNTGDTSVGCHYVGYSAMVFLGKNQGTTVYNHTWCPDATWYYYYYNQGTSNVLLSTNAQYYFPGTEYYIEQIHT